MSPSLVRSPPTESQIRDKEFADLLHGQSPTKTSGYTAVLTKNQKAQDEAIQSYFSFWDANTGMTDEKLLERRENYTTLVNAYYNISTDMYEYGWAQSFHFCRFYRGEGFYQAIARHQHYLAMNMEIKSGDLVLDVGCGVGGPAREIASFTGCKIVGLNNNDYQIIRAREYASRQGLSDQITFVKGDFMKMPFPDNTFDRIYSIEATAAHAPAVEGVYSEIFRVLKPGGVYGTYEWLLSEDYDPENKRHRQISYDIEMGAALPGLVKKSVAEKALDNVGFELLHEEDLADKGDAIPWYYPLAGQLKYVRTVEDFIKVGLLTKIGRYLAHEVLGMLEFVKIAPKGAKKAADNLILEQDGLLAGGKELIFTPMQLYIARKPVS